MKKPGSSERRVAERKPVRLKVAFRNARALLTEYTTSVSKGGCRIESRQPLKVGTRFIFEMFAKNSQSPVEIEGVVTRCDKSAAPDLYEIGIQYTPSTGKRAALEGVLDEIFDEHRYEKARLHPRLPVNLVAGDAVDPGLKYLIRDLSRGGMGLRLPASTELPAHIQFGTLVCLAVVAPPDAPAEIGGEVVWTVAGRGGFTHPAIGVAFVGAGVEQQEAIDALCRLQRTGQLTLTFSPRGPKRAAAT